MVWNPNPVAFNIFGVSIAWYGLTWSLAVIIGYFLILYIFKKEKKDLLKVVPYIQFILIGSLLGARIFEMVYYQFDYFIQDPTLFFRVRGGGLSSHGAMLGTISAIGLFVYRNKEFNFYWLLDRSVMVILLQGAIIRIGNFMNSELYGTITDIPWAIKFLQVDTYSRHPIQLYESIWYFSCFLFFFKMYNKYTIKKGIFTSLFLILVLSGRVVLEFLKEAENYILIFSKTQTISLIAILIGILIFQKNMKLYFTIK